jgi:hypothetical protein
MESFNIFFKKTKNKYGKTKNPQHTTLKRVADRGIGFRSNENGGSEEGLNFVADRYKEGDHNFDQNKNQYVGPISNEIAFKLCKKHKIDLRKLPSQLGKRPFQLVGCANKYKIERINKGNSNV